jgi:hypothetical protein
VAAPGPGPLATTPESLGRLIHARKIALRIFVLAAPMLVGSALLLAFASIRWLAAIALVFLCWFVYLLADTLCVRGWRHRAQAAWLSCDANLGVFASAVATIPFFPRQTVQALLRTLPVLEPSRDQALGAPMRRALAAFADWRWAEETTAGLLPSAVLALLGSSAAVLVLGAVPVGAGAAMLVPALFAGLVLLRVALPRGSRRRLDRALRELPEEARAEVAVLARGLDWSGTTAARRERLLRDL